MKVEAERSWSIKPIPAIEIKRKSSEMAARGVRIIDLSIGDTDFRPPDSFLRGIKDAFSRGLTHYTLSQGIPELRERIAKNYDADKDEVLISAGGKEGTFSFFLTCVDEGDDVLFPEPAWPPYRAYTNLCKANPITLPTTMESDFIPSLEDIKEKITGKTRLLIVNSPNNPTGAVYPPSLLKGLAELADDEGFMLFSDEIYSNYVHDGPFTSAAEYGENVIVLDGFSKTFGMTGIRLCYLVGRKDILRSVNKIHGYNMGNAPSLAQYAALGIMEEIEYMEGNRKEMRKRAELAYGTLSGTPGLRINRPKGAFYMHPRYEMDKPSVELCGEILAEKKVALVPGIGFGTEKSFRIAFSQPVDVLEEGLLKIKEYFEEA